MKKLNRKEIMARAWAIYRTRKTSAISICLKAAWREYKLATMKVSYEIVCCKTNEVKFRGFNEDWAYNKSESHNKVFFDDRTYVREVFSKAA